MIMPKNFNIAESRHGDSRLEQNDIQSQRWTDKILMRETQYLFRSLFEGCNLLILYLLVEITEKLQSLEISTSKRLLTYVKYKLNNFL